MCHFTANDDSFSLIWLILNEIGTDSRPCRTFKSLPSGMWSPWSVLLSRNTYAGFYCKSHLSSNAGVSHFTDQETQNAFQCKSHSSCHAWTVSLHIVKKVMTSQQKYTSEATCERSRNCIVLLPLTHASNIHSSVVYRSRSMSRPPNFCSTVACSQSWCNLPMSSNPIQSNLHNYNCNSSHRRYCAERFGEPWKNGSALNVRTSLNQSPRRWSVVLLEASTMHKFEVESNEEGKEQKRREQNSLCLTRGESFCRQPNQTSLTT